MKKRIFKIILLIVVYMLISVGIYFVLKLFGLTEVNKIRSLINKTGVYAYIVFFLFQICVSTFVCIIPFEDEVLALSAILLFGPIKGFFVASFNMFATSCLQFFLGRYFCKGLIVKILGDNAINKYQKSLSVKGEIMLPILYAIPLFPHDSLCILSGMTKMKFWYFAIVTILMRSIEVASLCFLGSGLIDFSSLTVFDWMIMVNVLIIDVYLIYKWKKHIEDKSDK